MVGPPRPDKYTAGISFTHLLMLVVVNFLECTIPMIYLQIALIDNTQPVTHHYAL